MGYLEVLLLTSEYGVAGGVTLITEVVCAETLTYLVYFVVLDFFKDLG